MPFGSDFLLGPFNVSREGRLSPRDPERPPGFSVRWRGCSVHAALLAGRLALTAVPGRVPSTAGGEPERRERCFAALRGLPASLPGSWTLTLLADHRVQVTSEEALDMPTSAVELVSMMTRFLLALAPYLDLLEELGVGTMPVAPSAPAVLGSANV